MQRLKFEMWAYEPKPGEKDGYMSRFTDGKGKYTESWWSNPPSSINHVCLGYLSNRFPNVKTEYHCDFIKRRFMEEMLRLKPREGK